MTWFDDRPQWARPVRLEDPVDVDRLVRLYLEARLPDRPREEVWSIGNAVWPMVRDAPAPIMLDATWWTLLEGTIDRALAVVLEQRGEG